MLKHFASTTTSDSDEDDISREERHCNIPPSPGIVTSNKITSQDSDSPSSSSTNHEAMLDSFPRLSQFSLTPIDDSCSEEDKDHVNMNLHDTGSERSNSSAVVFDSDIWSLTPSKSQVKHSSPCPRFHISPVALKSSSEKEKYVHTRLVDITTSDENIDTSIESEIDFNYMDVGSNVEQPSISSFLDKYIEDIGINSLADKIFQHDDLRKALADRILKAAHKELKTSIKTSKLKKENSREYLLSLTPTALCEEFRDNSPLAFSLLVKGLYGMSDETALFQSQKLLNATCLMYSIIAKCINKKAIGYALFLTTIARAGGLKEDSIKLLSAALVHPRTSQKYDRKVLSQDWDSNLKNCLQKEKDFFSAKREAELRVR